MSTTRRRYNNSRLRLDSFFELPLEERLETIEEGRLERAAELAVLRLADGRSVVTGSNAPYHLSADRDPVCYCLDAQKGQGRCKHVLAVLRRRRNPVVRRAMLAAGLSAPAPRWTGGAPVRGTLTEVTALVAEDAGGVTDAHLTWLLTHPEAGRETWLAIASHGSLVGRLGLTRSAAAMADRAVRGAVVRGVADGQGETLVRLRLLPWLDDAELGAVATTVASEVTPRTLAMALRSAGGPTVRRLPRALLMDLLRHDEREVREIVGRAFRAGGIERSTRAP